MRVLVTGSGGMLGRALLSALVGYHCDVTQVPHSKASIEDHRYISQVMQIRRPDVVINAAGVIPLAGRPAVEMIRANAVGPHVLAALADTVGARMIHVSTDCVFSGSLPPSMRYIDGLDVPDATDHYGRSKALGEVAADHVANIRTSFVGPSHGLWAWLRGHGPGQEVEGWEGALWTGSTVYAVAERLAAFAAGEPIAGGIYHLATEAAITKADAVEALNRVLGLGLTVRRTSAPTVNRALAPSPLPGGPLTGFAAALERLAIEAGRGS